MSALALSALAACDAPLTPIPLLGARESALTAYCEALVTGVGVVSVEDDYLPRVVSCENGGAPLEALKAQAVAARSYLYYKLDRRGEIADGQSDQVYTCSRPPTAIHYEAVRATAGEVLLYGETQIAAFYVAGARPSAPSCVASPADPDSTNTERFVTYNAGRSGDNITQTSLGWVDPSNRQNRGCQSQNGASCLAQGGVGYQEILRFYYGEDISIARAQGACAPLVEPEPQGGAPAAGADAPQGGAPAAGADEPQGGAPAAGADEPQGGTPAAGADEPQGGPQGGAPAAGADGPQGDPTGPSAGSPPPDLLPEDDLDEGLGDLEGGRQGPPVALTPQAGGASCGALGGRGAPPLGGVFYPLLALAAFRRLAPQRTPPPPARPAHR